MTVEKSSPYQQKRRLLSDSGEEGSFLLHTHSLAPHDPGGGEYNRKGKSQPCSPRMRHVSPCARNRSESVPSMGITYKVASSSPEVSLTMNGHRFRRKENTPSPEPSHTNHRSRRDTKVNMDGRGDSYKDISNTSTDCNKTINVSPSATKEDMALEAVMM